MGIKARSKESSSSSGSTSSRDRTIYGDIHLAIRTKAPSPVFDALRDITDILENGLGWTISDTQDIVQDTISNDLDLDGYEDVEDVLRNVMVDVRNVIVEDARDIRANPDDYEFELDVGEMENPDIIDQ